LRYFLLAALLVAIVASSAGAQPRVKAGGSYVLSFEGVNHGDRADRALVVAPATLTVQWLGELYRKFHQTFVLLDRRRREDVDVDARIFLHEAAQDRLQEPTCGWAQGRLPATT